MFKKLLLSLLVAVPVIAQAEWLELSNDKEYKSYIDPDRTVSTSSSLQQAETWIKMIIHTDLSKDGLSVGDHKMAKYKVKCNSNEIGLAAVYAYKKTGQMINSYVPSYVNYEPVIPESKGEFMAYVVCNYLYGEAEE